MNYYEQFYDDLEFDDQYYDHTDDFDARNYRQKPYDRNDNRRGQGRGQHRGQGHRGQGQRGRGQNNRRGQDRGGAQLRWRGQNSARGRAGKITGNFQMTNFVKAGELTPNTDQPIVSIPTETGNVNSQGNGTQPSSVPGNQTGNQPPPPPQQENSFNFSNPYYGYGERTDISNYYPQPGGEGTQQPGTQLQDGAGSTQSFGYEQAYAAGYYQGYQNQPGYEEYWAQQQAMHQPAPPGETMEVTQPTHVSPDSNTKAKKPMVIPKMNFVKSAKEFKSTEISPDNASGSNQGNMSAKSGSRAGLGFGKPTTVIQPGPRENKDIANQDAKFVRLVQAVEAKSKGGKNALEVLHMAVQKVKGMVLDFDISPVVSTTANFQCIIMINGIHIGSAAESKKKSAKQSAGVDAMNLLTCGKPLTVRKSSAGHYELKPKVVDVLHPTISNEPGGKGKKGYTPSQGGVITTKQQSSTAANNAKEKEAAAQAEAYSKPKIVFHPAGQQTTPKPLMGFVKGGQEEGALSNEGKQSNQLGVGGKDSSTNVSFANGAGSTSRKTDNTTALAYNKPKIVFHSEGKKPTSKPLSGFVKEGDMDAKNSNNTQNSNKGSTQSSDVDRGFSSNNSKGKANRKGGPNRMKMLNDMSQFVLVRYAYNKEEGNGLILSNSANFNGTQCSYEYDKFGDKNECTVSIGGLEVGEGVGQTKDEAKADALKNAVSILQDMCYTVVCKVKVGCDENSMDITKDELLSGDVKDNAIESSNIGNALLRKMGWVGGGIGKDGTGIAEPVKATGAIGRKGLGLTGSSKGNEKKFIEKVTQMLTDFKNNDTEQEIHFSSELTKEERAQIHQIAGRMKLKSVSRGVGDDRYLTISHKVSLDVLLNRVIDSGGSSDKYEIIPPKNPDLRCDFLRRDAGPMSHSKQ